MLNVLDSIIILIQFMSCTLLLDLWLSDRILKISSNIKRPFDVTIFILMGMSGIIVIIYNYIIYTLL